MQRWMDGHFAPSLVWDQGTIFEIYIFLIFNTFCLKREHSIEITTFKN